jgi:hypothetical protein
VASNNLIQFLHENFRIKKKDDVIYKFAMNDFKEPNGTMKTLINKNRSDFFKTRRESNVSNTNRPPMQLNLANPVNNVQDDPRASIALYTLRKIQKDKCNKYLAYIFIILDDQASSELKSKNNITIIQ